MIKSNKIQRFLHFSFNPRYANLYGMELHNTDIDFHSNKLNLYYGSFEKCIYGVRDYTFDKEGVFIFNSDNSDERYNPCGIAECAIISYEKMFFNEIDAETTFLNQINWLEKNGIKIKENEIVWYYPSGIYSGISQGMIIAAFLRAFQYYNNKKYLDIAWGAFNFMNKPIEKGGCRYDDAFKCWYEEAIDEKSKILNGQIYSLLGVFDLYRVTQNENIKECFEIGCNSIKQNIKKYDLAFFTKYDAITKYPADNSYHYIHITLFRILYKITNDDFYNKYANKFNKYHKYWIYKIINLCYLIYLTLKNKKKF